jgi:hypothetical protein
MGRIVEGLGAIDNTLSGGPQGGRKSKFVNPFRREGDEDKEGVTVVAPSRSISRNSMPQNGQGTDSFHSDTPQGTCRGL